MAEIQGTTAPAAVGGPARPRRKDWVLTATLAMVFVPFYLVVLVVSGATGEYVGVWPLLGMLTAFLVADLALAWRAARPLASALVDVLRHGSVRDDLRSKAVHRAGELPTAEQAVEAALAAYRSVGVGRA